MNHLVIDSTRILWSESPFGNLIHASFFRTEMIFWMDGNSMSQVGDGWVSNAINILAIRIEELVSKGCHSGHKFPFGFSPPSPLLRTTYSLIVHQCAHLYCFLMVDWVSRRICYSSFKTRNDSIFIWLEVHACRVISRPMWYIGRITSVVPKSLHVILRRTLF